MAPFRTFVALGLTFALAGCASVSMLAPVGAGSARCFAWKPTPPQPSPLAGALTPALFTQGDFRLGSRVFEYVPRGGYPIEFKRDGSVATQHLAGVDRWRIGGSNSLELLTGTGALVQEFRYNDACGTLTAEVQQRGSPVTIEISRIQ